MFYLEPYYLQDESVKSFLNFVVLLNPSTHNFRTHEFIENTYILFASMNVRVYINDVNLSSEEL